MLLMDYVLGPLWAYVVPFVIVFTILVFVHEMGHYLVARHNGVRVEVFSIGFGPEIRGWTDKLGTRWKICAVPLGGYVKMLGQSDLPGDEDAAPLSPEDRAVSFNSKRLGQRAAIVVAGPLANILFAILMLAGLFNFMGTAVPLAAVGSIQPGSAADQAGFKVGDRIIDIDGQTVTLFEDLRNVVRKRPGQALQFKVSRDGGEITLVAAPTPTKVKDAAGQESEIGLLGVGPHMEQVKYESQDPLTAGWLAVKTSYRLVVQIFSVVGEMITGERDTKDLGGPIRIAQFSGDYCHRGVAECVFFIAMLSMNLGLINLFPIPVLDGGHLAFFAAEGIRGRPLSARAQEYGFRFGLILVLLLMIFVTWNDLVNLEIF